MDQQTIIRTAKRENPYVMLDKSFLSNDRLSWKAKGLLTYLLSKPDDWQIREKDLIKQSTDGRDSIRAGLRGLESAGYLVRHKKRNKEGQFCGVESIIYEKPRSENPTNTGVSTADGFSNNGNAVDLLSNECNNVVVCPPKNTSQNEKPIPTLSPEPPDRTQKKKLIAERLSVNEKKLSCFNKLLDKRSISDIRQAVEAVATYIQRNDARNLLGLICKAIKECWPVQNIARKAQQAQQRYQKPRKKQSTEPPHV